MKDIEKFKEDIQNILEKFQFNDETRRKFFSLLVEYAEEQQAGNPKKGNQKWQPQISILYRKFWAF